MPVLDYKAEKIAEQYSKSDSLTEADYYKLTDTEVNIVGGIFSLFRDSQDERDRRFAYFDDRTLIEYIDDSVKRFVTNVYKRDDLEEWQAKVHQPFTRNKVLAILGKVIDALPVAEFFGRGDEDILKVEILNTLFEYSDKVDNVDEFFVYALEEALVKGTMVGYEGIETKSKKVRDITKYKDGDDISVKENDYKIRRLRSYIVKLEEFYPCSVGIRDMRDMPYCFLRQEIPYSQFQHDWNNFDKAKYVKPFNSATQGEDVQRPFYLDYVTPSTQEGNVEIIRYYNQDTDEYIIIANGIWLNPIGDEKVSPLPFNHKRLPFWVIRYDIFGSDFFYGKSMPDKLSSLQDVLDVLQNMLLDQSFLSIFKPILMAGVDDVEDDFLRPGRRISLDTQGIPINQAVQVLDLGTPSGWHQFILEYTKKVLEESSVDSVSQGVVGTGSDRTTATEVRTAAAGVSALLGLFARFIRFGVKGRAELRARNILQFYTDPTTPILDGVLGEGGSKKFNKAFNVFRVDSSALTPGDRGTKIIEIFQNMEDMPTKKKIAIDTRLSELTSGKKITKIAVLPEYIRDFDFDIDIVANPHSEMSKEVDRALEIQFQQTMNTLYPDLIDRKELAAVLIQKFGRQPSKILNEQAFAAPMMPEGTPAGNMMPGPGGDNSANTVKGATGVGGEGVQMRDMMR